MNGAGLHLVTVQLIALNRNIRALHISSSGMGLVWDTLSPVRFEQYFYQSD